MQLDWTKIEYIYDITYDAYNITPMNDYEYLFKLIMVGDSSTSNLK